MKKPKGRKSAKLRLLESEPEPTETKPEKPVPPSTAEWQELYAATARLRETAPWKWMWDSEVFGIRDPGTGETGFCSVNGRLGKHFALVFYLGGVGLAGLLRTLSGKEPQDEAALFELQDCLMASLVDKDCLEPEDFEVTGKLGLDFGADLWPQFRRYRPRFFPWFLTAEEAKFLTVAIDQALAVCLRVKADPGLLDRGGDDVRLVRSCQPDGKSWKDEWLDPRPLVVEATHRFYLGDPPDPDFVARLRQAGRTQSGTWEVSVSVHPEPMQDRMDEPPFYAIRLLLAEHNSGFILGTQFSRPDRYSAEHRAAFLETVQTLGALPQRVMTKGILALGTFEPVCRALDIKLDVVKRLPELERLMREVKKRFPRL